MQGLADCAVASVQLLDHALDLLTQTDRIQVHTEDVGAAVQVLQAAEVLLAFLDFQRSHDGLQLGQHRIGRDLKGLAVVINALQVAGIACQHQRDQDQIALVQAAGLVSLDGLAEADGQLLGGIGSDTLGCVGHEGVGQAAVDDRADELIGVQDARIDDDGHRLDVADLLDEGTQILIGHFGRDEGVVQHAAIDGHGGVQRVQAGADLHLLDLIDGLAVAVQNTAQLQRRTAIGVVVLDAEILGLLGVDEGSGEGVLLGDDGVVVLKAVVGQHLLDLGVGARGDLVDHAPGEGDLGLVLHISEELGGHQALLDPLGSVGEDGILDLVAVVRAVVHALHGQGQLAGLEALIQQSGDLAHGQHGGQAALQVRRSHAVALLGDGEGDHLQAGVLEDLDQTCPVGAEGVVSLQALGDGGDDLLLDLAGGLQADQQAQVIVGAVSLVDDLIVEALGHDDAAVILAAVQGVVQDGCGEGAEDVACAEVHPGRLCMGLGLDGLNVELGQLVAFFCPLGGQIAVFDIRQLHFDAQPFFFSSSRRSSRSQTPSIYWMPSARSYLP